MDPEAIFKWAEKLSRRGMADFLKNGKEAVTVSLMLPEKISEKSRSERKEILRKAFEDKLNDIMDNTDLEVDFSSISPSAQTIQAKLGIEKLQPFLNAFKGKGVEVYPNTNHTID